MTLRHFETIGMSLYCPFWCKMQRFYWLKMTEGYFQPIESMHFVRPHEFNQSNLRFLVKNTLLNNSHLERFDTVCTPFPMERHIYYCFWESNDYTDYWFLKNGIGHN